MTQKMLQHINDTFGKEDTITPKEFYVPKDVSFFIPIVSIKKQMFFLCVDNTKMKDRSQLEIYDILLSMLVRSGQSNSFV